MFAGPDGRPRGLSVDVLREAARRAEIALEWVRVPPTNEVWFSTEWKQQLGFAEQELTDRFDEWESRVHPDDRPAVMEKVASAISGGLRDYQLELRLRHRDGSYRWILAQASIERTQGLPQLIRGSHIDITEQKATEQRLAELTRFTSHVLDSVAASLCVLDHAGRVVAVNRVWEQSHRTTDH